MITIHFLRHGETVWHHDNRYAGVSDVALTDRGRQQAQDLAPWAAVADIRLVATSDLSRAIQTGQPVAAAAGVAHHVELGLREVDFGRGEGLTRTEMHRLFPDELAAFLTHPGSVPLPGGERGIDAADRGLRALAALSAPFDGETIAVVAHSTLIRLLLCRLLGLPLDDYRRRFPVMGNATVTTVRVPAGPAAADLEAAAELIRFNAPAR